MPINKDDLQAFAELLRSKGVKISSIELFKFKNNFNLIEEWLDGKRDKPKFLRKYR